MYAVLGQVFAILTAACWTQNSIIYSYVGKRLGSNTVTHMRLWLAIPAMIITHLIFTGNFFPLYLPHTAYFYLIISGIIGFFVADLFIFNAFVRIGARETLVILTTSPIFSALISWVILDERLTILQIIGILTTVFGVMWVIYEESRGSSKIKIQWNYGVLIALAGALAQAVGMILAKKGLEYNVHPISANFLRLISGLVAIAIFSSIRKEFINDFRKLKDLKLLLLLIFAAFVGPVLGIILALYALSWSPVGIVTTLMQISPVMLLPIDYFFFKKKITPGAILGTIVAIFGAALLFINN